MRKTSMAVALAVTTTLVGLAPTSTSSAAPSTQKVTYAGYSVRVPAGWRVVDLTQAPRTCVSLATSTVYLGTPSPDQDCSSADRLGGAPVLVIQPLTAASARLAAFEGASIVGSRGAVIAVPDKNGESHTVLSAASLLVSSYGGDDATATLRTSSVAASARPADKKDLATAQAAPRAALAAAIEAPGTFEGKGFDACAAPSGSTMSAWSSSSPYSAVGIYISGSFRGCAQPNLTASWMSARANEGWHFLPIDVGRQAPCTSYSFKISYDTVTAEQQGRSAAANAISAAQDLGIGSGSVIYSDIENYDRTNSSCNRAVLSYATGWTDRLHESGYGSGVYSSVSSGIKALSDVYSSSTYTRPDHIWGAKWDGVANTDFGSYVDAGQWANHQRVKQYKGGHNETWGGATVNIDSNYLDVRYGGGSGSEGTDTPGFYFQHDGSWHLNNNRDTTSDHVFDFGTPDNTEIVPVTGDWDGDGDTTTGFYFPHDATWHLNNNRDDTSDYTFKFGTAGHPGVVPVTGDWNGDGTDTVGFYFRHDATWHLNNNRDTTSDYYFKFGTAGHQGTVPITGDWNGNGTDTPGLYFRHDATWHLDDNRDGTSDAIFKFGTAGHQGLVPVTGDWNNYGGDNVGFYFPHDATWHLNNNRDTTSDYTFKFGTPDATTVIPITGNWDGA